MPCYEINTVSLEFKAKNIDVIVEVLNEMDLRPLVSSNKKSISTRIGTFNLESGSVEVQSWNAGKVNQFRVKYSEKILKIAATKNKWVVKRTAERKFVAKKW